MWKSSRIVFGRKKEREEEMIEYSPLPVIRTSVDDRSSISGDSTIDDTRLLYHPDVPGPAPTASQAVILRRVPAKLPWTTYAIALVELAERASFYGVVNISANFIQRPLPPGGPGTGAPPSGSQATSGALGMGLQWATSLTVIFTMLGYTTPLLGGALADMRWGKYKTIMIGVILVALSHLVIVYAARPSLLQAGTAFIPFLSAMILLCSSTGLIKANIAPVMAEQYTPPSDYVETLPEGETVIVDREVTIQRIMSAYYASINVGAFLAIASSIAEKYVGFWLAFLIPGVICLVMPFLLVSIHPFLSPAPPISSSPLIDMVNLFSPAKDRPALDFDDADLTIPIAGKAKTMSAEEESKNVKEVCKFFLFFAIYNVADGGLYSLYISLAGSMTTNGIPNDILNHANPLTIIISIPLLNRYLYPFLQNRGIRFGPVRRVVTGFVLAAIAMGWCALLQQLVYETSPCEYKATSCDIGTGVSPLSAWLALPTPILLGISESMAIVSSLEIAYLMSPPGMRSTINAVRLFTQSLASILVLCLVPLMHDPLLVAPFLITAIVVIIAAWAVWHLFGHLDTEKI